MKDKTEAHPSVQYGLIRWKPGCIGNHLEDILHTGGQGGDLQIHYLQMQMQDEKIKGCKQNFVLHSED